MIARPDSRPEIEPYYWDIKSNTNLGVLNAKEKPGLIICDPPYFDKKAEEYAQKSISMLPRKEYLKFFERFFAFLKQHTKNSTTLAFINADWRDCQNKPAVREITQNSILVDDYLKILDKTGWPRTILFKRLCHRNGLRGGWQCHAKKEDTRGNQPVCDNFKPGRIVSPRPHHYTFGEKNIFMQIYHPTLSIPRSCLWL